MWEREPITCGGYRCHCGPSGVLIITAIVFILVTLVGIGIYASQRAAEDNYIQSVCQVMSSQLLQYTCEESDPITTRMPPYPTTSGGPPYPTTSRTPSSGSTRLATDFTSTETMIDDSADDLQRRVPCYLPQWNVQYNDLSAPVINAIRYSIINGGTKYTNYYTALNVMNGYLVGRSYTCYFDQRSPGSVQWTKPTTIVGIVIIIVGAVLFVITLGVLIVRQIRMRCLAVNY